jgi:hypothetical protein
MTICSSTRRLASLTLLVSLFPATTTLSAGMPQNAGNADTEDCTAAAPEPTLRPNAYRLQSFRRTADNGAEETATLPSGIRVRIEYAGCADSVSRTFKVQPAPKGERYADHRAWARFARKTLLSLETDPAHRRFAPELTDFLDTLSRMQALKGRHEVCMDGSKPGLDGCSFNTGGGYFFEVVTPHGKPMVIVGDYNIL